MQLSQKQALVFGATGISGWALVRECLKAEDDCQFSRVIAISKRPLTKDIFMLPETYTSILYCYDNVDLTKGDDAVLERFRHISGIDQITHVYYSSYAGHGSDYETLKKINVAIHATALNVVTQVCSSLEVYTLQTGAKNYGVEFYGREVVEYNIPLVETAPRIPEPYRSFIFYYPEVEYLKQKAEGQFWIWREMRPDIIVGYAPRPQGMGFAQALGVFLAMYRSFEGAGAEVVFPSNEMCWKHVHNETSQDIFAHAAVSVSLTDDPDVSSRAFNIADTHITWDELWPELCALFGLKGIGPNNSGDAKGVKWVMERKERWKQWETENGLREGTVASTGWDFLELIFRNSVFDRQYDLTSIKKHIGHEERPAVVGYEKAFAFMKAARILP